MIDRLLVYLDFGPANATKINPEKLASSILFINIL